MQRPYDAHGANAVIKITVFTPLLCVQCVDAADFAVNVTPAVQIGAAVFFVHIRVVGRDIDAVFPILSGDFRQFVQQLSGNSLMTVRGKRIHEAHHGWSSGASTQSRSVSVAKAAIWSPAIRK